MAALSAAGAARPVSGAARPVSGGVHSAVAPALPSAVPAAVPAWRTVPMLLLTLCLFAGACSTTRPNSNDPMDEVAYKLDAPLRNELRGAAEDAVIVVLVKIGADDPADLLADDGLDVTSVTGEIVAARGTKEAILRAALRSYVHRIELSRVRPRL